MSEGCEKLSAPAHVFAQIGNSVLYYLTVIGIAVKDVNPPLK